MKKFDLSKFDEYRENNRLEVKKAQGGLPNSLWETYSSMANCYGGVIILGVLENKDGSFRTTGLKDAAKMQKEFWDCVNNSKKVSLNLLSDDDIEIYDQNDDVIMVIKCLARPGNKSPFILIMIFGTARFAETGRGIIIVRNQRSKQCFAMSRKIPWTWKCLRILNWQI